MRKSCFTREDDLLLTKNVKKHECLYNEIHINYRNMECKNLIWISIAHVLNKSVSQCKTRWNSLRKVYANKLRNKRSGLCSRRENWFLYQYMDFLEPHTKYRINPLDSFENYKLYHTDSPVTTVTYPAIEPYYSSAIKNEPADISDNVPPWIEISNAGAENHVKYSYYDNGGNGGSINNEINSDEHQNSNAYHDIDRNKCDLGLNLSPVAIRKNYAPRDNKSMIFLDKPGDNMMALRTIAMNVIGSTMHEGRQPNQSFDSNAIKNEPADISDNVPPWIEISNAGAENHVKYSYYDNGGNGGSINNEINSDEHQNINADYDSDRNKCDLGWNISRVAIRKNYAPSDNKQMIFLVKPGDNMMALRTIAINVIGSTMHEGRQPNQSFDSNAIKNEPADISDNVPPWIEISNAGAENHVKYSYYDNGGNGGSINNEINSDEHQNINAYHDIDRNKCDLGLNLSPVAIRKNYAPRDNKSMIFLDKPGDNMMALRTITANVIGSTMHDGRQPNQSPTLLCYNVNGDREDSSDKLSSVKTDIKTEDSKDQLSNNNKNEIEDFEDELSNIKTDIEDYTSDEPSVFMTARDWYAIRELALDAPYDLINEIIRRRQLQSRANNGEGANESTEIYHRP